MEDLRTSPGRIVHPQCYVADSGLDALLALIRASDERQRRDAFSMHTTLMKLRQQSGSSPQQE